jgi:predicted enzyme related to lactoylglutathione lyase
MPKGTRKTGEFCWFNMLTPQPAAARAFFGRLLGWTYAEIPGIGHRAQVGGRNVGGVFDLAGPNTPPGTPPCIGVMVKVESADAAAAKVKSLGGKAKPAFDIMDQGRMAECLDPNGAEFDVWEPKASHGTEVDSTLHGAPSWCEALTTDVALATTFYSNLFGWTPEVMRTTGLNYTVFKHGTESVAGMLEITPQMGNIPPHWAVYFTVKSADETVREALDLGAKICMTMKEAPGVGRFCGFTSPQGVPFNVIEYTGTGRAGSMP